MRLFLRKIKPTSGFAHFLHLLLVIALPVIVFVLVRLDFVQLALSIIVLSKWRMFAVRPRFWAANIRANAVDLMVGLSIVLFMTHNSSVVVQVLWAVLYAVWLLVIKPASSMIMVSAQAFIGLLASLMALYLVWNAGPIAGLTVVSGLVCFMAAHHFLDAFDEPYAKMLSYTWGYFGAALAWLLGHVLITYPNASNDWVAQPVVFLCTIGAGLAILYYLDHVGRLSRATKVQTLATVGLITLALVVSLYMSAKNLIA
jgi:hypothetical protein